MDAAMGLHAARQLDGLVLQGHIQIWKLHVQNDHVHEPWGIHWAAGPGGF